MHYEGTIYRPPSEANSLIVQATIGCSHNTCTFCSMYKDKHFRLRSVADICRDIEEAGVTGSSWKRVFLADGDALIMPTESLLAMLKVIRKHHPNCSRVGIYGSPQSILLKSTEDLTALRKAGLGIVYLGAESGCDDILHAVRKGFDSAAMAQAGIRVREAGLKLSVMLISGLGSHSLSERHAIESANLMRSIQPDYLSLLTLLVEPGTVLNEQVRRGEFALLGPLEVLQETRQFLHALEGVKTIFRSNHASNYLNLSGNLPEDRERLIRQIDNALAHSDNLKAEYFRRL